MSKKTTPRTGAWSKKIIASRTKNKRWHKNMLEGRRIAKLNPSIISLLRMRKNMRQVDLAKNLDITEPTFSQIERGKRPVKRDVANKIASTLGVTIAKIFTQQKKKFVALIQKQDI